MTADMLILILGTFSKEKKSDMLRRHTANSAFCNSSSSIFHSGEEYDTN